MDFEIEYQIGFEDAKIGFEGDNFLAEVSIF